MTPWFPIPVCWLLLMAAVTPVDVVAEVAFEKQILTERFVAEGCAVADFDRDGHADITAGNLIWHGPDFARTTEFTPPADNPSGPSKTPYDPARGYSDYFLAFGHDFTGDGWSDILVYGLPGEPAHVFVNPQGKAGHWQKHAIFDVADGESPGLVDMTGDGRPELLVHSSGLVQPPEAKGQAGGQLGFAEINWASPLDKARFHPITPRSPENDAKYFRYTHGYGAGDVNGDGRLDLVTKDGWFEQPADRDAAIWPFHPGPFGPPAARGGAQMLVLDVNGDGRSDVITSYDAHGCGFGWYEQRGDGSFVEHRVMGATPEENEQGISFSQLHALAAADIDGDGQVDIVTGKRRWAHGVSGDIDPNAPPVLYWFRLERAGSGGPRFVAHEIDADSGVGTQVTVADLDADGKADVVVANKRGVFAFRQK
ncbi:MAG: FG-GAP repeat domain-containing protein [Pirellulales bacterium]